MGFISQLVPKAKYIFQEAYLVSLLCWLLLIENLAVKGVLQIFDALILTNFGFSMHNDNIG